MARFREAAHRPAPADNRKPKVVKEQLQLCRGCGLMKVYRKNYGASVCQDCMTMSWNDDTDETVRRIQEIFPGATVVPQDTERNQVSSVGRRGNYRPK